MARVRSPRTLIIAAVFVVALVVTHTLWMAALGRMLVRSEAPVRADAAVVLAGDFAGRRIVAGAELAREGFVPKVVVSGPCGFYGVCECDLAIAFAVKKGYPAQSFVAFPHKALSTAEEADAVVPELRRMNVRRYLLVTSDYHTGRAARIFHRRAPDLEMHVIAAPDDYFSPSGWWKQREGIKRFVLEWEKTVATLFGI